MQWALFQKKRTAGLAVLLRGDRGVLSEDFADHVLSRDLRDRPDVLSVVQDDLPLVIAERLQALLRLAMLESVPPTR
jgi:hypothetical protein